MKTEIYNTMIEKISKGWTLCLSTAYRYTFIDQKDIDDWKECGRDLLQNSRLSTDLGFYLAKGRKRWEYWYPDYGITLYHFVNRRKRIYDNKIDISKMYWESLKKGE